MTQMYKVEPAQYVGLWQLRGVRASVLDKSIMRGDEWVQLDRVTAQPGSYWGHVGTRQFQVGSFSGPPLYIPVDPRGSGGVDGALLDSPLNGWPAQQAVLDWLQSEVQDEEGSVLHRLEYVSHASCDVAALLRKIAEDLGAGADDHARWTKLRAIQLCLRTAADLSDAQFQSSVEGSERLSEVMLQLAAQVKGR